MNFITKENVSKEDKDEIFQGLLEYNLARIENKEPKDIGIFLEDDNGTKLAGLIGETHGNWLEIDYLWVTESLRKDGIGTSLLGKAELIARERGCKYAFLNTFHFQAPAFYEKNGYKEVFTLNEYPNTGKRHYYTKVL